MNLDKIYKENKGVLREEIKGVLEEKFGTRVIFLAGNGITLTYPSKTRRTKDNFCTLALSKRELSKILKGSTLTVKTSMSHKVDTLVWSTGSWYSRDNFDKYTYEQITWDEFLQPVVDYLFSKYKNLELM